MIRPRLVGGGEVPAAAGFARGRIAPSSRRFFVAAWM